MPQTWFPLSFKNDKVEGRTFKLWITIFKGFILHHMIDHQQKVHDYKAQVFWHSLKTKGSQKVTVSPPMGKVMKLNIKKA